MAIATVQQVQAVLGREMTSYETAAMPGRIASAVAVLEGLLHRTLELGSFVETRTPIPSGSLPATVATGWSTIGAAYGRVALAYRPVASVTSVVVDGVDITAGCVRDHDVLYTPTLAPVTVTYLAGDDPVAPQVRDAVVNATARGFFVSAAQAAGVDVNYSVEGTTISYPRAAGDPRSGPFTGDELRALRASLGLFILR